MARVKTAINVNPFEAVMVKSTIQLGNNIAMDFMLL